MRIGRNIDAPRGTNSESLIDVSRMSKWQVLFAVAIIWTLFIGAGVTYMNS